MCGLGETFMVWRWGLPVGTLLQAVICGNLFKSKPIPLYSRYGQGDCREQPGGGGDPTASRSGSKDGGKSSTAAAGGRIKIWKGLLRSVLLRQRCQPWVSTMR
jgi:hypothetical protein